MDCYFYICFTKSVRERSYISLLSIFFILVSFKMERINIASLWLDFQSCLVLGWMLTVIWLMLFFLILFGLWNRNGITYRYWSGCESPCVTSSFQGALPYKNEALNYFFILSAARQSFSNEMEVIIRLPLKTICLLLHVCNVYGKILS